MDDALQSAATTFAASLSNVDLSGLTNEVQSAIDAANQPIELHADASGLTDEIDSALANVDTSGVDSALQGVNDSLDQTATSAKGAGDSFGNLLGPAVGLATGKLSSAGTAASELVPQLAGAAAATAILVEGGHALFSGALEQATALQRLKTVFGEQADAVGQLHAGGFNLLSDDLEQLSRKVGANVDPLRIFIAKTGELAQASGRSAEEGAKTGETIVALAAKISAANPTLGTADEIVNRLGLTLGRGGFRLTQYGLDITAAQIKEEAYIETHKKHTEALSTFEKQTAGANLAVREFGGNLQEQIDKAADQPIVKLRSLKIQLEETLKAAGSGLVGPGVESLAAITPIVEELARVLGQVLADGLHLVEPLLSGLSGVLVPLVHAFEGLPGPVRATAEALLLLKLTGLSESVASLALSSAGLSGALLGFAGPAAVAGIALLGFEEKAHETANRMNELNRAIASGTGLEEFDRQVKRSSGAAPGHVLAFGNIVNSLRGIDVEAQHAASAFEHLAKSDPTAAGALIQSMKDAGRDTTEFEAILRKINPAALDAASGINATSDALNGLTPAAQAADKALGDALTAFQSNITNTLSLEGAQTSLRSAIDSTTKSHEKSTSAGKSAAQTALDIRSAQLGIVSAQFAVTDSAKAVADAQKKLNDLYVVTEAEAKAIEQAQRNLVNAQAAYTDATDRVTEAQQHLLDVTRAATAEEAAKARRDVAHARLAQADAEDALQAADERVAAAQLTAQRAQGRSTAVQTKAAEELDDALRAQAEAQLNVADAADHSKDAQKKAADQLDGSIGTAKDAKDAQKGLDDAQRSQAAAAQAVTDAQDALTTAQKATQVSSEDLQRAQEDLDKAELGQQQAVLGLDEAHQRLFDSQNKTGSSASSATNAADAYTAALERQKSAAFALVDQLDKTREQQLLDSQGYITAQQRADIYRGALTEVANTTGIDGALRQNLLGLANQVRDLTGDKELFFKVHLDQATVNKLNGFVDDLNNINQSILFGSAPNVNHFQAFAGGTPGFTGLAVIGERGPELVNVSPGSTASVLPADQTAELLGPRLTIEQMNINQVAESNEATGFAIAAQIGVLATR